jgi:alanine-glyoxylate transaminase/serine-glyoxylate transaminase/serine-pyruvate transaminase
MNGSGDPRPLVQYCDEKCGVVLGIGIGALSGKAFRIAHMGHVNAPMILGTLGVIEVGLQGSADAARYRRRASGIDWLGENVCA